MLTVKNVMSKKVITVSPETPIFEALDLLTKHKISGMPVVDKDNRVLGILSEKDVLRILLDDGSSAKRTVSDYMTHEVITYTEDDNAVDICKFFIKGNIRRVPIVKDGKLVGIVSRRDIVNLILEAKKTMADFRFA